ncbi:MAG: adenine phosphoribosyltransferase [Bacteroidota bacterium]
MTDLKNYIREVKDFPKAGISYKDITPLLSNINALRSCVNQIIAQLPNQKIDKVVGIESRGFFLATLLADRLDAGFIPIRKPGKLPAKKISVAYELEYGTDSLEIHTDAIKPGEKVLLHDDVLATGGTAKAAVDLIEKLGGKIVQCNFLIELRSLNGKLQLKNKPFSSLIQY